MLIGDRSAVQIRLRGLLLCMYTMNNHTYNAMRICDSQTYKALHLSCLGAKDTTQKPLRDVGQSSKEVLLP